MPGNIEQTLETTSSFEMTKKVSIILTNIRQGKYHPAMLDNIGILSKAIEKDIPGTDPDEVMAILGFLLEEGYIEIDPVQGFILTDNPELQCFV